MFNRETDMGTPHIIPRRMDFPFDPTTVPRHWFGGNATASLKVNSINLIFPDGEQFFIRSVKHYLPQITDPDLKARARAFFAQEALHGREHARANDVLREQGFELDSWLVWYKRTAFGRIEKHSPPIFRLAVTAALEHLTASLAHQTLTNDLFQNATPVMRDLMAWHAAEEIEHKSVAFDVLQAVNSSWLLRVAGMVWALVTFLIFWSSAWRHLSKQDPAITREQMRIDRQQIAGWGIPDTRKNLIRYALRYFRPTFHPDDQDDYPLAASALERIVAAYPRREASAL